MSKIGIKTALMGLVVVGVVGLFAGPSSAGFLYYHFDTEFSGGAPPDGPKPWLTAIFEDTAANEVKLTLRKNNENSNKVTGWYFNLNPDLSISSLTVAAWGSPPASIPSPLPNSPHPLTDSRGGASASKGTNAFKADGDGFFDIWLDYPTSAPVFDGDEYDAWKLTYTGAGTFDVNAFKYKSVNNKGNTDAKSLYAAAHVQSIGARGEDSGWVHPGGGPDDRDIPEASSLALCGLGGLGLLLMERRRRRK